MKQLLFLFLFLLVFSVTAFCQLNGKDKELFIDAEYYYLFEDFDQALPVYQDLVKRYPDNSNINYRIGMCLLHIPLSDKNPEPKKRSIPFFLKAIDNINIQYTEGSHKEEGAPSEAYFYLANAYRSGHLFDEAINAYEKFKTYLKVDDLFYIDYVNREIQATRNAKELIQFPIELDSENLGGIINSPAAVENCPVISNDETVLVYTAGKNNNFSPDIALQLINQDYEMDNIFYSFRKDTTWSEPKNIMKELGCQDTKTAPAAISGDGKTLYLVRDDNDNGNIYVSHFNEEDQEWSTMKKLSKNINTKYWESHVTIVPDGTILYFTSDRPDGYGGLDIYKSVIDENGEWGPATNLGSAVNTMFDEETPFILNDGKTLYFSSQGHYSMGGFDVFHTKLLSNGKWSTPLNLGYPINTVGNDLFYLPKANGEYAFFPLNNNERGFGSNDIYRIQVVTPESGTPEITLNGIITLADKKNVLPENTSVYLINKAIYDTTGIIKADILTGNYSTQITAGDYKVLYRAKGYMEHEENLFIPDIYTRKDIVINVELVPLQVTSGKYFVIRSIFFDYGKFDLRRESKIELEKLGKLMNENPSLYVEIIGHTDSRSSASFNLKLSEQRSRSAIDYLINMGVNAERFVSTGKGETQHIAINENSDGTDSPEGRQLNRRVEIKIIKSDNDLIIAEGVYVPPNLTNRKSAQTYTILVKNSITPLPADYFKSRDTENILNDIEAINGENGILYVLGNYKNKSEALKLFNKIIDLDFEDARIIDNDELNQLKPKDFITDLLNKTTHTEDDINNITKGLNGDFFTIQLKALSRPIKGDFFKNLKEVNEHLCEDGFYRYTYLQLEDYQKAIEAKKEVIDLGYTDAFIVKSSKFSKIEDLKGDFTIQITALTKPVKLNKFSSLGNVKEHISNDGLYKYTYGSFNSYLSAKKELKKVAKKGYPDAFVVSVEKYSE